LSAVECRMLVCIAFLENFSSFYGSLHFMRVLHCLCKNQAQLLPGTLNTIAGE
jgi:hypothetical protein